MTEQDRREFAQHVAIQLLYFVGQREKDRFLNSKEMAEARETVDAFMAWFFGESKQSEQDARYQEMHDRFVALRDRVQGRS